MHSDQGQNGGRKREGRTDSRGWIGQRMGGDHCNAWTTSRSAPFRGFGVHCPSTRTPAGHQPPSWPRSLANKLAATVRRLPRELVPDAVNGHDEPRNGGVVLDLLAQLRDVHVDRARQRRLVVLPDLIQQAVPRNHLAAMRDEVLEQPELPSRHRDGLPPFPELGRLEVDHDVAEGVNARGPRAAADAAQQRLDPRRQLHEPERLRHVVVRAELQADHLVDLLAPGGQHEDRHAAPLGAKSLADLHAAELREHHVQDDDVGGVLARGRKPRLAVPRERDLVPFVREAVAERGRHRGVVLDEEHPGHQAALLETGRRMVNVLPFPGSLSTEISPPCATTMWCTIDKPRPLPLTSWTRPVPTRWKRSKTRLCSSEAIPTP